MRNEKIAIIGLAVIIFGSLSLYLAATYGGDILENLFKEEEAIALGDCADVNYIGRYAKDNTIFDSSYEDVENKTGGTPLQIFVSLNKTILPPDEYGTYLSDPLGMLEGFISDLVGMKEGEAKTVTLSPAKAYGANKLKIGDTFTTTTNITVPGFDQTMEVTNLTSDIISLKWINVENPSAFTMPAGILMENLENAYYTIYDTLPPYHLWENSSEIINITEENVVVKTTPTKTVNITEEFDQQSLFALGNKVGVVFPDATTAEWNETTITLTSSPIKGTNYTLEDVGVTFTIGNVTEDNFNISYAFEGQSDSLEINRTIEFDRTYYIRRNYNDIPLYIGGVILAEDLEREGYNLYPLAGEELIFEVMIEKVYKTS